MDFNELAITAHYGIAANFKHIVAALTKTAKAGSSRPETVPRSLKERFSDSSADEEQQGVESIDEEKEGDECGKMSIPEQPLNVFELIRSMIAPPPSCSLPSTSNTTLSSKLSMSPESTLSLYLCVLARRP